MKGVAQRGAVPVSTAAIWLARIGIFANELPAISRAELIAAIDRGDSVDAIRRKHRVTDRTVVVELLRHDLHEARKRRHMRH